MLRLYELKAVVKGEFFIREELRMHEVKKVEVMADIIIKPTGKKSLQSFFFCLSSQAFLML